MKRHVKYQRISMVLLAFSIAALQSAPQPLHDQMKAIEKYGGGDGEPRRINTLSDAQMCVGQQEIFEVLEDTEEWLTCNEITERVTMRKSTVQSRLKKMCDYDFLQKRQSSEPRSRGKHVTEYQTNQS